MDLQSFLQSGLLESYALGQCSPAERNEVEVMLAQHEIVRTELKNVEMALEQYAQTEAIAPPSWMKGRIGELLQQEQGQGAPTARNTPAPPANRWMMLLSVAVFLLASLLVNSLFKAHTLKNELNKANIQLQDCEEQKNKAQNP